MPVLEEILAVGIQPLISAIYLLYPHNSKYNLRLYTSFEINLG